MIEDFNLKYSTFFNQPDYKKRWGSLVKIYAKDYNSFRVLFFIEALSLIDKWQEPSSEELNKILENIIKGGRIAVGIGNVVDLLMPVWPLEMAKYDLLLFKKFLSKGLSEKYFLTSIKLTSTALVQIWWAFETLMNDFSGIIKEQRKDSIDRVDSLFLDDKNVFLNKKGEIETRYTFQPIDSRIQYVYHFLTGEKLDRSSSDWQNLMNLKNARDAYTHRVGKDYEGTDIFNKNVILKGFKSVQNVIRAVFQKTPEFSERFIYKFLSFWSCSNDLPFVWDGRSGDSFYLGLTDIKTENIIELFAPMESSFSMFLKEECLDCLTKGQKKI